MASKPAPSTIICFSDILKTSIYLGVGSLFLFTLYKSTLLFLLPSDKDGYQRKLLRASSSSDLAFEGLLGVFDNSDNSHTTALSFMCKYYFPAGLQNLGNTCYMNALLQSLTGCKLFMDYVKKLEKHICIDCKESDDIIVQCLIRTLLDLARGIADQNPQRMYHVMCEEFTAMYEQQDSHEFLFYLQDKITRITAKHIRSNAFDMGLASEELLSKSTRSSLDSLPSEENLVTKSNQEEPVFQSSSSGHSLPLD